MGCSDVRPEDLHALMQVVVEDKRMRDTQTMRFHGMTWTVVEVPDLRVVIIDDP